MKHNLKKHYSFKTASIVGLCLLVSGCDNNSWWSKKSQAELNAEQIKLVIPMSSKNRQSWADDIFDIMNQFKIPKNKENVCSIVAVVDQESNFIANPVVPGLGAKAVKEINIRLSQKFEDKFGETIGKQMAGYFEDVLKNQPSPDNSYMSQMRKVKTERDLDQLYREIFDFMASHYHISALTGAAKLVGQDFSEKFNPITTLGSMQVLITYAQNNKREHMNNNELRDDLYTQYGGLYYGIHRLMMYEADYDKPIYRFADYNSGMYSSRNAAIQTELNALIDPKEHLDLDGDLLIYNKDGSALSSLSDTEKTLIDLFNRNNIVITPDQIRADLEKEKQKSFEKTKTYYSINKLYEEKTGKEAVYAVMPEVIISGPKLSRDYNTNWYASRVNGRYQTCLKRAKKIKL